METGYLKILLTDTGLGYKNSIIKPTGVLIGVREHSQIVLANALILVVDNAV